LVCEHLSELEAAILARNIGETFRGQPWSKNCREWVYFDAYLDLPAIRKSFALNACVQDHVHRGTHDGQEAGLVCSACHDAVIGLLEPKAGKPVFPGEVA